MSRYTQSIPPDYFDALYSADPDPWRFETSEYEKAKYGATLAALPRERYASALEVGCSIGVLTTKLARRCDALLATDVVASALSLARRACAVQPHVRFALMRAPAEWPEERFDLIVLSEVAYYLDSTDLGLLASRVAETLLPSGDVALVHWLGKTHYPLTGDEAAEGFIAAIAGFASPLCQQRTTDYRLDILNAPPA